MEEETDKTTVEENQTDGSGSSSDEKDLDTLSVEELKAEVLKKTELAREKDRLLREQSKKHEAAKKQPKEEPDEDEEVRTLIREEAKKVVQEEQQNARISSYSKGSTEWLKEQSWAKDMFGEDAKSDSLYAKFSSELKRLSTEEVVDSQEEYRELMRLAAVRVTRRADALLEASAERDIEKDKTAASYRGSAGSNTSTQSYAQFNQQEQAIIQRVNARRAKAGQKPLKPSEIIRK